MRNSILARETSVGTPMKNTGNAFMVQFDNSPKNSNPDQKQSFISKPKGGGRSTANMTTRKSQGSILLPSFAGVS